MPIVNVADGTNGGAFRMSNVMAAPFETSVRLFMLIFAIWMHPGRVAAESESPILGIIATDNGAEPFADLLTVAFSGSDHVQLVEREQMAEIFQELKLNAIQKSDSVAIGRMTRASALLFIDHVQDSVRIRISETQRGELLYQHVFPSSDMPAVCDMVVRHFPSLASKLSSSSQRVYIAVRPIQMPGASREDAELLSEFRYLLEARLFSDDNVVLVERENLADIVGENGTFDEADASSLSAADYVIRILAKKSDAGDFQVTLNASATKGDGSQLVSDHFDWRTMNEVAVRLTGEILKFSGQHPANLAAPLAAEADMQLEMAQKLINYGDFLGGIRGMEIAFHLHPNPEQIAPQLVKHISQYIRQTSSGYASISGNHYAKTYAQEPDVAYMDWVHWLRVALGVSRRYAQAARELEPNNELYPFRHLLSRPEGLSPDQEVVLRDFRAELRAYFEWRGEGMGASPKNPAVKLFPLFFEEPEDAVRYMKTAWQGDPAFPSLKWKEHPFTRVTYWDTDKAQTIWFDFLDELIRDGTQAQQFDGLSSKYEYSIDLRRFQGGSTTLVVDCARELFNWLNQSPSNHAWLLQNGTESTYRDIEFGLQNLPIQEQNRLFRNVIIPVLMARRTQGGTLGSYLGSRYYQEKEAGSVSPELPHLAQEALDALATYDSAFSEKERHHLESTSWYREMMAGYSMGPLPIELPELEMKNEVLLDLVRAENGNYFECSGLLLDEHKGWICWKTLAGMEIAGFDLAYPQKPPAIGRVLFPPSRSQFSSQTLHLIRWRKYLVVSGLDNIIALPLDDNMDLQPASAIVLGPQIGDSAIGIWERNVSALVSGPDGIYICLDDWNSTGPGANAFGGVYRWVPENSDCEKICASDSLASGPLNDCLPYQVVAGSATADGRGVILFVAGSVDPPSSGAISPQSGVWRYDIEQHALSQLVSTNLGYLKMAGMSPARTSKDEYAFETSKAAYCFNLGANSLRSVVGPPKLRPFVGRFQYRTAVPTTNGWLFFFFKVRDGGDSHGILCHMPNDGK